LAPTGGESPQNICVNGRTDHPDHATQGRGRNRNTDTRRLKRLINTAKVA
jgi:hypothetical protein